MIDSKYFNVKDFYMKKVLILYVAVSADQFHVMLVLTSSLTSIW